MAAGAKGRDDRVARERARVYNARQEYYRSRAQRRTRDNLIAAIAGGALILAAIGGQVVYFTSGPGAPEPEPTPTPTSPAPTPGPETPAPTPEPTTTP
ncbi:dioxygenase [Microbacterium sp. zg.Y1090]|uniref:dioxygenase n=1 Tax=Microbacterium TaxID=33882 RepID=UPI00214C5062|nr:MULTISPECIES: dioxygenase [unclassified Microbacterium]MCR2811882.1 dioxygenase [Microbacterium sp. zg.Y1084]MCR2818679.1 dioxygenase [Microbacterium sp. zg.Y1090]MDL5486492.1 dioxygenase [Microbacterium sp. zg-Y1211]WIM27002.1 dioxygenase [Microbacterium sp. zg-Y1090]